MFITRTYQWLTVIIRLLALHLMGTGSGSGMYRRYLASGYTGDTYTKNLKRVFDGPALTATSSFCDSSWITTSYSTELALLLELHCTNAMSQSTADASTAMNEDDKYAMIIEECETVQRLAPKATLQLHPCEADNNAAAVNLLSLSVAKSIDFLGGYITGINMSLFPMENVEWTRERKCCYAVTCLLALPRPQSSDSHLETAVRAIGEIYKNKIMDDVTSWVAMRTDTIISNSRYTSETVIEDIQEFGKLLQDATRAATSKPEIASYFKMFGVDYYSAISRRLDLKLANPVEDLGMKIKEYQICYQRHAQNISDCNRAYCSHCAAVRCLFNQICRNIGASERVERSVLLKLAKYRFWPEDAVMCALQTFKDIFTMAIKNSFEFDEKRRQSLRQPRITTHTAVDALTLAEQVIGECQLISENVVDVNVKIIVITKLTDMLCDGFLDYANHLISIAKTQSCEEVTDGPLITPTLCTVAHNLQRIQQYLDQLPSKLGRELKVAELLNQEEIKTADIEQVLLNLVSSTLDDINQRLQSLILHTVDMATDEIRQLVGFVTAAETNLKTDCLAQEDFGAYLREYVAGNISYLQASEFEEMFGTLRDALWSSIVAAFCNLINKCQPSSYYAKLKTQIADLWVIVFPDGLLPVIDDVYRQHQELMNNLEELAVPSEELMLNYYKSLSPLEVRTSAVCYGKILVGAFIQHHSDGSDEVRIMVERASGLPAMLERSASNTYVRVALCPSTYFPEVESQRTRTVYNTTDPRFNQELSFAGLRRDSLLLEGTVALISVWHSDSLLLPDVFLGEAVLPLCNIRKTVSPAVGMMNGKKLTIKMPDPCAPLLATVIARCGWDPVARQLMQERCVSANWSEAIAGANTEQCNSGCGPISAIRCSWINALTRLKGRRQNVPAPSSQTFVFSPKPTFRRSLGHSLIW